MMLKESQAILCVIYEHFESGKNEGNATAMQKYMKEKFEFFGIKSPDRKDIQKKIIRQTGPLSLSQTRDLVRYLWHNDKRECQYFAMELLHKHVSRFEEKDIEMLEFMILNKSWWDTVDFIAANLVGKYLDKFKTKRAELVLKWINSGNLWLCRTALLFQLRYKSETDQELLSFVIKQNASDPEFFIRKAIGWALRDYSKTNPLWVINFVNSVKLSHLSEKEALRIIIKNQTNLSPV